MTGLNKRWAITFSGIVQLVVMAVLTASVFTACSKPNTAMEIEGVWRLVSVKELPHGDETKFPDTLADGSKQQPWLCMSNGKMYAATETTGKKKVEENGLFKQNNAWGKPYVYKDGKIS